jgi:hypothetical protein
MTAGLYLREMIRDLLSMTLAERRLILLTCTKLERDLQTLTHVHSVSAQQWESVFGQADIPAYTLMADAADTLLHRPPTSVGNSSHVETFHWLCSVNFLPNAQILEVSLTPTTSYIFQGLSVGDGKFEVLTGLS